MVSFRWKFILLGLLPAFNLGLGSTSFGQSRRLSVPITLPSLVQGSTRIFVGTVDSVFGNPRDPEVEVTVTVTHALKGPYLPTTKATFRFAYALANPLSIGERVLWFLPLDSPVGFSVPLGYTNGDFRIDAGGQALSLSFNRGLWDSEGQLWDTGECSRSRFLDILDARGFSGREILRYLKWADSPYLTQSFPLPFMTAAVLSCLTSSEYQRYLDLNQIRSGSGNYRQFH